MYRGKRPRFLGGEVFGWALLPLFILAATHTEIGGNPERAGLAVAIRTGAFCALMVILLLQARRPISTQHGVTVLLIVTYLVVVNLLDLTYFSVMASLFVFSGLIIASLALGPTRPILIFLCRAYLIFNLIGLALGGAILASTGKIVDLHQILFPWSAARVAEHWGVVRLTGFQIEPGTYANSMYIFVLLSGILRRQLFGWLETAAILSTILTFSAWAIIGAGVYSSAVGLQYLLTGSISKRFARWAVGLAVALTLAGSASLMVGDYSGNQYVEYFLRRFDYEAGTGSAELKAVAFGAWKEKLWLDMALGHALPDRFCDYCKSPQDIGTLLNLFYYFGLLPSAYILIPFGISLWRRLGFAFLLASSPLLVAKFFFYDPLVWTVIGLGLFSGHPRRIAGSRLRYQHEKIQKRSATQQV